MDATSAVTDIALERQRKKKEETRNEESLQQWVFVFGLSVINETCQTGLNFVDQMRCNPVLVV